MLGLRGKESAIHDFFFRVNHAVVFKQAHMVFMHVSLGLLFVEHFLSNFNP